MTSDRRTPPGDETEGVPQIPDWSLVIPDSTNRDPDWRRRFNNNGYAPGTLGRWCAHRDRVNGGAR